MAKIFTSRLTNIIGSNYQLVLLQLTSLFMLLSELIPSVQIHSANIFQTPPSLPNLYQIHGLFWSIYLYFCFLL